MTFAEISLGADARSPGVARRFLFSTLNGWDRTELGDDAALLLSELVTNAALHARTQIRVRIEMKPACLRLGVTDSSPRQPAVRHYSEQSTTGRGLALVSALASQWGIETHPDGTKTVWAEVAYARAERLGDTSTVVDLSAFPDLEDAGSTGASGTEETSARLRFRAA